jgi:hypothetical protein
MVYGETFDAPQVRHKGHVTLLDSHGSTPAILLLVAFNEATKPKHTRERDPWSAFDAVSSYLDLMNDTATFVDSAYSGYEWRRLYCLRFQGITYGYSPVPSRRVNSGF